MKILITGGDGFCGWPTSLHLSSKGHDIHIIDNLSRRAIATALNYESLTNIYSIHERIEKWYELTGRSISFSNINVAENYAALQSEIASFNPECIVHLAAQRSAPYSMMSVDSGNYTLSNNVLTTNNVLKAITEHNRAIKFVHLGSIGVYGYEDRDFEIAEGKTHFSGCDKNNRPYSLKAQIPFNPTSIYHLSKSQITSLLNFYTRNYGLNITDLYQGIVWGTQTSETNIAPELSNRFDYDEIYGTVLNRFVVQAQSGLPITVYGRGEQTRAFIHIQDTVRCIETAVNSGATHSGDVDVMHQIAETRTVKSVADHVAKLVHGSIKHVVNPRDEEEEHRYILENTKFKQLGLSQLNTLGDNLLDEIQNVVDKNLHRIDQTCIDPKVQWGKVSQKPDNECAVKRVGKTPAKSAARPAPQAAAMG